MSDVDQTLTPIQPDHSSPVTPEVQGVVSGQTVPATPDQTPPTEPIQPNAEILFRDFLEGKPTPAHPVIDIHISPMVIKKMEDGGVVISPSGEIAVKYKVQ